MKKKAETKKKKLGCYDSIKELINEVWFFMKNYSPNYVFRCQFLFISIVLPILMFVSMNAMIKSYDRLKLKESDIVIYSESKGDDQIENHDLSKTDKMKLTMMYNSLKIGLIEKWLVLYSNKKLQEGFYWYNQDFDQDLKNEKKLNILDLGCGCGILTEKLSNLNFNVTGMDKNRNYIRKAVHQSKEMNITNINYKIGNIFNTKFNKEEFDVIILSDVLENVKDLNLAMMEINRILKPDGLIIFSSIMRTFYSWFMICMVGHNFGFIKKNNCNYKMLVNPHDLYTLFNNYDIDMRYVEGVRIKTKNRFNLFNPIFFDFVKLDRINHFHYEYRRMESRPDWLLVPLEEEILFRQEFIDNLYIGYAIKN